MNILSIIFWILLITSFSLIGSWYARKYKKTDALVGIFVAFVIVSNIIAYKIAEFDFGFTTFYATSAALVFSVTFLLTDIVNEKFGLSETRKMVLIAFIAQVASAFFIYLALVLPPAPFWTDQESFSRIIGFAPRIMIASWIAFIISQNIDIYLFDWFKKKTKNKHLWLRNFLSTIPALTVDTAIFVSIAFYGIQPLWPLIVGLVVVKWLVAILNIPFMYANRWILYKKL
jgi:hypothetical protein